MNYLTHRFSRLTSLVMLLIMSIGTAWLFSFATRVNEVAEGWISSYADSEVNSIPLRTNTTTSKANVTESSGRAQ